MLRGTHISRTAISLLLIAAISGCTSFPSMRDRNAANRQQTAPATATSLDPNDGDAANAAQAPADPTSDLWARIRHRLQLHAIQHPRITSEVRWFRNNPQFLGNTSVRAEPFLYHIVSEIERRGMPIELAFIPIVESAFQSKALSRSQASGIWQFIPGTGTRYGLKQDWWYDERRNFVKATDAALNYLAALHQRFNGDWLLAMAAYNNGEGNIDRALQRNRTKRLPLDFWSIEVRRETAEYVPRILAVAQIVAHPELYGQNLQPIANKPYFAVVDTGRPIDLRQLEAGTGIDSELFQALNASYRRNSAGPDGPFSVYVPLAAEQLARETIAALPRHARSDWQQYQIRPGDTLSGIAARFGTTVPTLQAANQMNGTALRAGQQLLIPPNESPTSVADGNAKDATQATNPATGGKETSHTVASGETLSSIAKRHGVPLAQLLRDNNLTTATILRVGQRLLLRSVSAFQAESPGRASDNAPAITYEVRSGDSLWRISNQFAVTVTELRRWNSLSSNQQLRPGQKLTVYPGRKI
ncbi:MAG: LysM peptidoglycan-binding domain-containing protein [Gammaproteobacteria bacterium]|nr:LysM peptidoglycan-binding domain-containing protein [Gammaproteobacteria bacterium]